jgi:mono/diheme cytochrome c family protein
LSIDAKLALLALMLGLAAFNLILVRSRLTAINGELLARFALAVRSELILGVAILGVAAILTGLSPARETLARLRNSATTQIGSVDRRVDARELSARVQVSPARVGMNHFAVELPGVDPAGVERVQLTLTYLDRELGSQPLVLRPTSGSEAPAWQLESPLLSQAGDWQAELLVRRAGQDDARSALRFKVTGPGPASAPGSPTAVYPLLPSPLISLAYVLIAVGSGLGLATLWRMRRRARRAWAPLASAGLVLACGGYVYAEEQRVGVPLDVANVRNPLTPDERSLMAGKATYTTRCAVCHGAGGRGDGPASATLDPPPADLRVHMAAGHSDGQLFYWVSNGFPGTAMPAWRDQLSEDERWEAINYIRTFATSGDAAPPNS